MTPLSDAAAQRPAEPALFAGLVDDAAVFPPGNAPLAEAVRLHRLHRTSAYAVCVGPLLVPVADVAEVARLSADGRTPLRVGFVARPGVPVNDVGRAVSALRASVDDEVSGVEVSGVEVSGVEFGWAPGWREVDLAGLARTVEVPRGDALEPAVADIAGEASVTSGAQAKFRTGATGTWAWPDEHELATFVRTVIDHDLPFKLTGGLHHVVRGTHDGQEQHGLLNVLVAVHRALGGADVDDLVSVLADRDPAQLVPDVSRMSAADVAAVRGSFTSYGCCEVTDPIGELSALHLLEEQSP
jgi:hypothetical protein